jgi:hypothetical protein
MNTRRWFVRYAAYAVGLTVAWTRNPPLLRGVAFTPGPDGIIELPADQRRPR